jgi:hypothetical protein
VGVVDFDRIAVGTKVVLRDGKVGIVVAKRAPVYRGGRRGLPVKLAAEGRTLTIVDPDEIDPI